MSIVTPLDVVTLEQMKAELVIDYASDDDLIEAKIKAAISLIEQETNWRFYPRTESVIAMSKDVELFQYPINSISAVNQDSETLTFTQQYWPLRTAICFQYTWARYATITLATGCSELIQIPDMLLDAIKRQAVYLFENRNDMKAMIPDDVAAMIYKFKRFTYF